MAGHTTSLPSLVTCSQRLRAPSVWDAAQRLLDILLVVAASPLWVPLLLLLVALKRLIDGGPLFFHHVRLGIDGRPFVLHKIRTTPLHFQPQPVDWSDENFPPRTLLGSWLRRIDLDELPQLWNVLRGEMSLVGPRPEMPSHASRFTFSIPDYVERLAVRPGITGLAQIRGWRGNTSIRQRLNCDLEYLQSRGPWTYGRILLATVRVEARRMLDTR